MQEIRACWMVYYPLLCEISVALMSSGSQKGSCIPAIVHWHKYRWEQVWITSRLKPLSPRRCWATEVLVQTCQRTVKLNPTLQVRPVFFCLACSLVWDN